MNSIGIMSVLSTVVQHQPTEVGVRSASVRSFVRRYILGVHEKTKRCLAEEAESGDNLSILSWIKDGSDVNEYDAYGYTPLINAAILGRLEVVQALIRSKADVNKKGPFGFTPLHAAAQCGHRDVVLCLLDNGAIVNAQNDDLDTPLHLALHSSNIDIVYILLKYGSNVFIKGLKQQNSIQTAKAANLGDLANFLEKYGLCMKQIGYENYN